MQEEVELRERFGAAGRAGGEGFAQTAHEKENKANFHCLYREAKMVSSGSAQAEKKMKSMSEKNFSSYIIYINFYHFK